MTGITASLGLGKKELQDIKELEEACSEHEILSMKLNWEMLKKRSDTEINDFLYYENGKLIGFMGLYSFGPKSVEIEITGMVAPGYRHQGIFRKLFSLASQECKHRGVKRILLITERCSPSGISFVKVMGSQYKFSEYRMEFAETRVPDYPKTGVSIRKANDVDFAALKYIDAICFGSSEEENEEGFAPEQYESTYVAELGAKPIGKIATLTEGKDGYIFGFGIFPEYRGRGYGREILSLTLSKLMTEKIESVNLEVATENKKALSLYQSCGFREITVYDYYEIVF